MSPYDVKNVVRDEMLIWLSLILSIATSDAQQTCEDLTIIVADGTFVFLLMMLSFQATRLFLLFAVCVKVLKDAMSKVPEAEKSKPDFIAKAIREHCESSKLKDHKFCFYIGALPESATSMMVDVTKPLSWSMPPEKVCEKLKAKDAQICELKYGECFSNYN
ncbi:hypothetical protein OSTOST_00497 [Ostertagia ostertagi]